MDLRAERTKASSLAEDRPYVSWCCTRQDITWASNKVLISYVSLRCTHQDSACEQQTKYILGELALYDSKQHMSENNRVSTSNKVLVQEEAKGGGGRWPGGGGVPDEKHAPPPPPPPPDTLNLRYIGEACLTGLDQSPACLFDCKESNNKSTTTNHDQYWKHVQCTPQPCPFQAKLLTQ